MDHPSTPGSPASFASQQSSFSANAPIRPPSVQSGRPLMAASPLIAGKQPLNGVQPFPMGQSFNAAPTLNPTTLDPDGTPRVLSKHKVQELVKQVGPSERLEPAVEDILLELADEFIQSATSFACRLAKHRKSDTLEVKDLQLHLERSWNMRVPGFASDDIRTAKKPTIPAGHQNKVQTVHAFKNQQAASSKKG